MIDWTSIVKKRSDLHSTAAQQLFPPMMMKTSGKTPRAGSGFRLTSRDVDILTAVYPSRVLTRFHIEQLLSPPGAASRCTLRLPLPHEHGYLDRQEQASKPSEGRKPY